LNNFVIQLIKGTKEGKPTITTMNMPKSIKKASNLIYFSILLSIVIAIQQVLQNQFHPVILFASAVFVFFIIIFKSLIAHHIGLGKNWARLLFTLLVGFRLINSYGLVMESFDEHYFTGIIVIAEIFLYGCIVYLLFKPESRTWYKLKDPII
jgi:hypothetical protein